MFPGIPPGRHPERRRNPPASAAPRPETRQKRKKLRTERSIERRRHGVEGRGDLLNLKQSQEIEKELSSLQDHIDHTYGNRINTLTKLLTSREVKLTVAQTSNKMLFTTGKPATQPDGNCLITPMGTAVFTEEVKSELKTLLNSFFQDVQPQLMKITERITTP